MPDYEPLLNRWQSAGVLDAEAAARIRAYEASQQSALTTARRNPSVLGWLGKAESP